MQSSSIFYCIVHFHVRLTFSRIEFAFHHLWKINDMTSLEDFAHFFHCKACVESFEDICTAGWPSVFSRGRAFSRWRSVWQKMIKLNLINVFLRKLDSTLSRLCVIWKDDRFRQRESQVFDVLFDVRFYDDFICDVRLIDWQHTFFVPRKNMLIFSVIT